MESTEKTYQAYLVRLWRDGDQGGWRASAQAPKETKAQLFADIQGLIAFLEAQTTETPIKVALPKMPPVQRVASTQHFSWQQGRDLLTGTIASFVAGLQGANRMLALAGGLVVLLALVFRLQLDTLSPTQLLGTAVAQPAATMVPTNTLSVGLTDVVAIAAGGSHNLALRGDGTVVAWGNNEHGQTDVPPGLTDVVAIDAGDFHSVALKRDGTVVVWGQYAK